MKIFVTGCSGYIGSHTCVELLNNGYDVVGLDDFSNSKKEVLDKIYKITGKNIKFYEGNMLDKNLLNKIFSENKIDCVIDFAAYKAVGESIKLPIEYYIELLNLFQFQRLLKQVVLLIHMEQVNYLLNKF